MSPFNISEYISDILINTENMSSGKLPSLVKTTLLPGQNGTTAMAFLPTNPSRDVTANIPIDSYNLMRIIYNSQAFHKPDLFLCRLQSIVSYRKHFV